MINITINNSAILVQEGTTVAAAILSSGVGVFRRSVAGDNRGPLCGMGICFECRVMIDGMSHQRSCMLPVTEGMTIVTDE